MALALKLSIDVTEAVVEPDPGDVDVALPPSLVLFSGAEVFVEGITVGAVKG